MHIGKNSAFLMLVLYLKHFGGGGIYFGPF